MTAGRVRLLRVFLVMGVLLTGAVAGLWFVLDSSHRPAQGSNLGTASANGDKLEAERKSAFSHIKVTKNQNTRTLWFVRKNGDEVIESMLNLQSPHDLIIEYTQFMFASYMFRPKQERVLIVGLGGGSMNHFLKHYDPNLKVDTVEIDPVIVELADKFFGVKSEGNIKIFTQDGFDYLKDTKEQYDVIYMDAFLRPDDATGPEGIPLRLQTVEFYKSSQKKLKPGGMMVFNLNDNKYIDKDLENIRVAFPQAYNFKLSRESGYVVIGSMNEKRMTDAEVQKAAAELDTRFKTNFSFRDIGRTLVRKEP